MVKDIFTKSQAVALLVQAQAKQEIDIFKIIDPKHKLFKLNCDELEVKLLNYLSNEQLAGVVEDPVFRAPEPQS